VSACEASEEGSSDVDSSHPDVDLSDSDSALRDASSEEQDLLGSINSCEVQAPGQITLPADDSVHEEPVEWWYWTGHLEDLEGDRYGYQITFFLFGSGSSRAQLANVALTEITSGRYHHKAKFSFGNPDIREDGFAFQLGPHSAIGGGGEDVLHMEIDEISLDLTVSTQRPAVLQHGDGYQEYQFGGYTYYYSRPHMEATGSLNIAGQRRELQGSSWFDHQWGDLSAATERGWDWFALNLDDGRDIMLFLIHGEGGSGFLGGSITDSSCTTTEIDPSAINITATGSWTSPESHCVYPSGWRVKIGDLNLELAVPVPEQEMYNRMDVAKSYWEGAVEVSGDASGRAYVELAGYCAP